MNRKIRRISTASAAVALLSVAGTAMAAPQCPETLDPQADYRCVFIDVGFNRYATGTKTGNFYELGLTGTQATSIYGLNGAGVVGIGSSVSDTNRTALINAAGFVGNSTYNSLSGGVGTVAINDTASVGRKNVDALNPLVGAGQNQGLEIDLGAGNASNGWRLTFDYLFTGTLTASGPVFTGGDIAFYFDDLSTVADENIQVLRINATGSTANVGNIDVFGVVSFDFDNDNINDCTTTFCQNFWNFQTSVPPDWYSLEGQGVTITFALDTNVNPPVPTPDQLGIGGVPGLFARQTTLDSSVRFNTVPEPTSIALVGLSLLGLAAGSARRNRKG
jgi:hypothetical protein